LTEVPISLEQLYAKSHKRIYDFLYKYTHNSETALDLMQDTFLNFQRAYEKSGLPEEKAIMVLYTIARNLSINFAKKHSNQKEISGLNLDRASNSMGQEKQAVYQDLEERLYSLLSELKEEEKVALLLKNVEGFSLAQIAQVLEVSISTASRLVTKAQERLVLLATERNLVPE